MSLLSYLTFVIYVFVSFSFISCTSKPDTPNGGGESTQSSKNLEKQPANQDATGANGGGSDPSETGTDTDLKQSEKPTQDQGEAGSVGDGGGKENDVKEQDNSRDENSSEEGGHIVLDKIPDIDEGVKKCKEEGKLFDILKDKCSDEPLAGFECSMDYVLSDEYKQLDDHSKKNLSDYIDTNLKEYKLYGCVFNEDKEVIFHFYKKEDRSLLLDYWGIKTK